MKKIIYTSLFAFVAFVFACKKPMTTSSTTSKSPKLPATTYDYRGSKLPSGQAVGDFINFNSSSSGGVFINPSFIDPNVTTILKVTDDGANLGRVLFYDVNLSLNNTVSCGSCHKQEYGFADANKASSVGFEGRVTNRSSMALANPITQNNLFWDSRSSTLQDLALRPVQNHVEMGMEDLNKLVAKLYKLPYYSSLFEKAYGTNEITQEKVANAISQFVASITTSNSKFDEGSMNGMNDPLNGFSNFTALENEGMKLFHGRALCSSCHAGSNFSAPDGQGGAYGGGSLLGSDAKGTANIGLDFVYTDNGRENGKFKIPSLRNIALTAPYMHDGRFATLNDVLNHYARGIKPHKDLDTKFKDSNGKVKMIDLTETDKLALIAFLNTLTDKSLATDPKYSNPFNY